MLGGVVAFCWGGVRLAVGCGDFDESWGNVWKSLGNVG